MHDLCKGLTVNGNGKCVKSVSYTFKVVPGYNLKETFNDLNHSKLEKWSISQKERRYNLGPRGCLVCFFHLRSCNLDEIFTCCFGTTAQSERSWSMSQNLAKADWRPEKISGLARSSSTASSRDWITSEKVEFFQITAIDVTMRVRFLSATLKTYYSWSR